jgi:hypothetical protein
MFCGLGCEELRQTIGNSHNNTNDISNEWGSICIKPFNPMQIYQVDETINDQNSPQMHLIS